MDTLVSVVVTAYNRPDMLLEALASIEAQGWPDLEIVVSDDSTDDRVEAAVAAWRSRFPLLYVRNRPALGAAANVEQLFKLARGERLVLLHDDDHLLPGAIETLAAAWDQDPELTMAYGKIMLMDHDGRELPALTALANRRDKREACHAGRQRSEAWVALVGQIPPNGFMIRTEAARALGVRPQAGSACDIDFNLRLAARYRGIWYVDVYVSRYRKTQVSNSTRGMDYHIHYDLLARFEPPEEHRALHRERLRRAAVPAVSRLIQLGELARAREIWRGSHYALRDRLTAKGLAQGLLAHLPPAAGPPLFARLKALSDALDPFRPPSAAYSDRFL